MNAITRLSPLDAMLSGIAAAARRPAEERDRAVADVIAAYVADPLLLEGRDCPCSPDRYVRHLLHADAALGYAVVAIAWRPGQMSPVHGHKTWCALGIHRGTLTESFYAPGAEGEADLNLTASQLRRPGATSHSPADPLAIHRLANLSCREAISIHAYGVPYDRFGSDVNLVYAA
ncbi:cysteine dioxygenase [Muricoccus radiodurans]|uniref:cysteine dioxygenase family protein n=1 Tax=Muricoccus radiodurans TaxID=2231721 RepID=UPI003CEB92FD